MTAFSELFRAFLRIGCLSFGGPAAQIALMHRELVDDRKWLTEAEYLRGLSFCMLLPGPEAMQLATYVGWKQCGIPGGLIAGGLFVIPGALVMFVLGLAYGAWSDAPWVQAVFLGVKAAVVAIVIEAILRVARRALKGRVHWVIAILAFLALFALHVPFPLVIAAAGLWGFVTTRGAGQASSTTATAKLQLRLGPTLTIIGIGCVMWSLPLVVVWALDQTLLFDLGIFFSKLAVVTFGGAYAVLSYMTAEVVQTFGWLSTGQMMDGLGLAETTPGPLILVTQFVGILAGVQAGGLWLGVLGGLMVLWVTFVPCFIWIFAAAPVIGWLEGQPRLTGALAAITAAVVGVIANLSIWFAAHVLFGSVPEVTLGPIRLIAPDLATLDPLALGLTLFAAFGLLWRHWSLPLVLVLCGALALALRLGLG